MRVQLSSISILLNILIVKLFNSFSHLHKPLALIDWNSFQSCFNDILPILGCRESLLNHGISARRWHDDTPNKERQIIWRMHTGNFDLKIGLNTCKITINFPVIYWRDRLGYWVHPQAWFHPSWHQTGQLTFGFVRTYQIDRFRSMHRSQKVTPNRLLQEFKSCSH